MARVELLYSPADERREKLILAGLDKI